MPCRDPGWDEWIDDQSREKKKNLKNNISTLIQLLCDICSALEAEKKTDLMSSRLKAWWEQHKEEDTKNRKAKERKELQHLAEKEASVFLAKRLKELGVE